MRQWIPAFALLFLLFGDGVAAQGDGRFGPASSDRSPRSSWWRGGSVGTSYLLSPGGGTGVRASLGLPHAASLLGGRVSPYVGGQHLGVQDAGFDGGFAGLRLALLTGRLSVSPFTELGYGRVQTIVDAGGYAHEGGDGYRAWRRPAQGGALTAGGGVSVAMRVAGPVRLKASGGYWNVQTPEGSPSLNGLYGGLGLAVGSTREAVSAPVPPAGLPVRRPVIRPRPELLRHEENGYLRPTSVVTVRPPEVAPAREPAAEPVVEASGAASMPAPAAATATGPGPRAEAPDPAARAEAGSESAVKPRPDPTPAESMAERQAKPAGEGSGVQGGWWLLLLVAAVAGGGFVAVWRRTAA